MNHKYDLKSTERFGNLSLENVLGVPAPCLCRLRDPYPEKC